MSRTEVKVDIKMKPPTTHNTPARPYIHRNNRGSIVVYEDQLPKMNNIVAKCRTLKEAEVAINDFRRGLDLHHSNVAHLATRNKLPTMRPVRKTVQNHTEQRVVSTPQSSNTSRPGVEGAKNASTMEEVEQMRISA